ncbi:amidophosphoribosyltransferase [Tamlana sedimentorum]|uniref:Amidophosphoribosyltransferase n=1 Tax=Neotamlana sedimentorum TaxID=1435349 RepID=A0A0D7W960_9FLAO|nr:phosphoribosyltransferase family protein [Tamlana sedimentorum]KJD35218.1 amidophosphoribosyltransferase [Tamlana sedimentorum]
MIRNVVNLFFPEICYACQNLLNDNEASICTSCRHDLPVTNFHFNNSDAIKKVLYGRAKIEHGTALFRFEKKGLVQQLIHGLKYKGYENIGFVLGNWLGGELKQIKDYQTIDAVIPVPLHKNKLKKRGYNQVAKFGEQLALALNAQYNDKILLKITNNKSQTTKERILRWNENQQLFALNPEIQIKNKHILLVDDIITTGATLEACINVITKTENVKISVATMAIA